MDTDSAFTYEKSQYKLDKKRKYIFWAENNLPFADV